MQKNTKRDNVTITVRAGQSLGPLKRIWRSIGYAEPNWTYTPQGKLIYKEIAGLKDGPFWVRLVHTFSSGNLRGSPFQGSSNCYREDADGNPVYDWTTLDRIYDVLVENGSKPMPVLELVPHDLSSGPPGRHGASNGYPPKDYNKWRELCRQYALHLIERYGRDEVRTWYFTSWNEPDGAFHIPREPGRDEEAHKNACVEEFFKIHDYAIDGLLAADDRLRVGGPDSAWPSDFLGKFLAHCDSGTNHATGKKGCRLDFISFHSKGTGPHRGSVPPPEFDILARRHILERYATIRKFPKFKDLPLLLNEWDMDYWSPGSIFDYPGYGVIRNTSYYPVFVIRVIKELMDVCAREKINVELVTQWTFYFHGFRCFEGDRSIFDATGIRRPLFNGFELLARLGTERLTAITDDTARDIEPGQGAGMCCRRRPLDEADAAKLGPDMTIEPYPQVDAMAARGEKGLQVLVWNQVVDPGAKDSRTVRIKVEDLGAVDRAVVTEYRVGPDHSNAHTVWQKLGCPDYPDEKQLAAMRAREKLETVGSDVPMKVINGILELKVKLPMHSVALFEIMLRSRTR